MARRTPTFLRAAGRALAPRDASSGSAAAGAQREAVSRARCAAARRAAGPRALARESWAHNLYPSRSPLHEAGSRRAGDRSISSSEAVRSSRCRAPHPVSARRSQPLAVTLVRPRGRGSHVGRLSNLKPLAGS